MTTTAVITSHAGRTLQPTDFGSTYEGLLQEIVGVLVERGYAAHIEAISGRYEVGELICGHPEYQGLGQKGTGQLLERLARDLDRSPRELYHCRAFYLEAVRHDGVQGFLDAHGVGKDVSWSLVKQLLASTDEAPPPPKRRLVARRTGPKAAVAYGAERVGQTWTQEDQDRLLEILNQK